MLIVSSSTSTSRMRMSPAITTPLSSTRSSTSARFAPSVECTICGTGLFLSRWIDEMADRSEIDIEIVNPELLLQLADLRLELHQAVSDAFDLVVREGARFYPAHRLFFHDLAY